MDDKKPKYDFSRIAEEYKDEEWIKMKTREKELIRIPIGRRMRDLPLIPHHVRESTYNYWKQMNTCEFPRKSNIID